LVKLCKGSAAPLGLEKVGLSGHLTLFARATGETVELHYVADLTDAANPHLLLTFRTAGTGERASIFGERPVARALNGTAARLGLKCFK
jgi:hypothetical protein